MPTLTELSSALTTARLEVALPLFVAATAVVAVVAPRLTGTVDRLSSRTRFGQTLAGAVLLGASTSLPGIMVTVVAALRGDVALAAANAIGGVAAQTVFLSVADVSQSRADLFQKTVSPKSLANVGVLLGLLTIPLFASAGWPDVAVGRIHPASPLLVIAYLGGLWITRKEPGGGGGGAAGDEPLWRLWARYIGCLSAVAVAGFLLGTTVSPIAAAMGLSAVAAGALLTALATSSPELITAVTAARHGQLHLAVGDIVGGNTFDVLFLAVADLAVASSLYTQVGSSLVLLTAAAILLNALVLLAFERPGGGGRWSPESALMLATYAVLAFLLVTSPPA